MNHEEFHKVLTRYREGIASKSEQLLVEEWYAKIGTDDVQLDSDHSMLADKYWKKINSHVQLGQQSLKKKKRVVLFHPNILRIAASVIFLMVLAYFIYDRNAYQGIAKIDTISQEFKSILNADAVIKQIGLPDGTTISLNPGSQIDFVESFTAPTREVYLKGEAFFSVKRDVNRPFIVYSNDVVTKVLGTSFRIKAMDDDNNVTVSVRTGKVCVYTKSKDQKDLNAVVIVPNQQIVFNREELKVKKEIVPVPEPIAEIQSTSIRTKFEGASVLSIFESIEEMYGLEIQADENIFKNCTLTTTLSEDELFKRLDIICKAIGATYRVDETTIIIEGPGCE
jgi:hypothetical protein